MSEKKKNIFAIALLGVMVLAFLNYWFNQRPGAKPEPQPQPTQTEPPKLAQDKGALAAKPFNAAEQQAKDLLRKPGREAAPARGGKTAGSELPLERPAVEWNSVLARAELDWGQDPFAAPELENGLNGGASPAPSSGGAASKTTGRQDPLAKLEIEGILRVKGQDSAIINDRVVQAGDDLEGFRVVSISARGVVLFKDGETHLLQLPSAADEGASARIQIRPKATKEQERQETPKSTGDPKQEDGDEEEDGDSPEQGARPDEAGNGAVFLPPSSGYKTPPRRSDR